ncbi:MULTISPECIES: helix-turn-helix domain-containing protein [unclassified Brevibacterium]|uniref:TetR/AcrR family transcriptional regulator n=1 Tax=unclassified Brevibacterium TaxID=2614124 RepID=UPI001E311A7C|nr:MULTISPECIES: helix-turn-helix domain-containing protein [unclassified Brevibacterium]MCD1287721.1 TetR/AcrR family transcriptional regulator [Brevibacterium sp. CCUG 69071]MDK8433324.1 helix-turn-helix domain-containing protein [Brevibacterium sp. H-BE7]
MVSEHVQSRSSRRLRTEEKIISAAAALFLEHGYRATTVRSIAQSAEVSVGRVMSAGDKDVLLVRCFDRWIGQLQSGTYVSPAPTKPRSSAEAGAGAEAGATSTRTAPDGTGSGGTGSARTTSASPRSGERPSAVQSHLLGIFLPFLEFFASHEDLSRDYAAALMRVRGKPEVFDSLALDLQEQLVSSLTSIGIGEDYARASASALYDSYLGILFRWAASTMSLDEAIDALLGIIAFHTRFGGPR